MNVKISEMPSATSLDGTELVPIVQSGVSKNVTKQILTNNNYSTSEQVVGTWIDGKPLYENTYVLEAPVTTSTQQVVETYPMGVANIDFRAVKTFFYKRNSDGNVFLTPCVDTSGKRLMAFCNTVAGEANICLATNASGFTAGVCYVTVIYTKTTD